MALDGMLTRSIRPGCDRSNKFSLTDNNSNGKVFCCKRSLCGLFTPMDSSSSEYCLDHLEITISFDAETLHRAEILPYYFTAKRHHNV